MSVEVRESLVKRLFFQDLASKSDLLDPNLTDTYLIEILTEILDRGYFLEITAVRTDHGPDGYLGVHSHQAGRAVDCWPLISAKQNDYLDEDSATFRTFLSTLTKIQDIAQVGLGGTANSTYNMSLLGSLGFVDNGQDHVHIGC